VSTQLVTLILGLASLLLIFFLAREALRRGRPIKASLPGGGGFEIGGDERAGAKQGLEAASQRAEAERPESSELVRDARQRAAQRLAETRRIRPASVLWVDDNPEGNVYENHMLSSLGLSITQVTTSEAALSLLKRRRFDLVITDLTRDEDASAGLKLLREISDGFPRIVYALEPGEREQEALKLGAAAVTTTPGDLLQAVLENIEL
jgi:CheY-like chemotaxis protein